MVQIQLSLDTVPGETLMEKLATVGQVVADGAHLYSEQEASSLAGEFISNTKLAPRINTASLMVAKRDSNTKSTVRIPRSAYRLDTMSPHYVLLKPNRSVTSWAREYFGYITKSRMSRVTFGPRGRISGSLFVTPDPFIISAKTKIRRLLPIILQNELDKHFQED